MLNDNGGRSDDATRFELQRVCCIPKLNAAATSRCVFVGRNHNDCEDVLAILSRRKTVFCRPDNIPNATEYKSSRREGVSLCNAKDTTGDSQFLSGLLQTNNRHGKRLYTIGMQVAPQHARSGVRNPLIEKTGMGPQD
jgi:hypothetical protein